MRIRELRKPKLDSDLSAEDISDKIGTELRRIKRHGPEAGRTDAKGPAAEQRIETDQRRNVEPAADVKTPVEGVTAESHSKMIADLYRRRRHEASGEEARTAKNTDGKPEECRTQHDSSASRAAAGTISGNGTEPRSTIDSVGKEAQTVSQNRKKCLTAKDIEDIRKMYFEEGLSQGEVAKELGVSQRQIRSVFQAEGWTPRRRGGRLDSKPVLGSGTHEEIRKLYFDDGLSLSQVGRHLGYAATTIARVLKREGWPARPQPGRTNWDHETIRKRFFDEPAVQKDAEARRDRAQPQGKRVDRNEAYRLHFEEGLPLQVVAERLSANTKTIRRVFREEGWVPRGLQKASEQNERSRKKNEYAAARRQEIASIRETIFGSNCRLCGDTSDRFSIHRKDGEKHVSSLFQSPARLRALNPEEWAYLDYDCHFAVHLMMNNFGYDWPRIERLAGNLREQVAHPPETSSGASQNDCHSEERIRLTDTSVQNADDLRRTMFGSSCVICGKEENEVHLVIHKKDREAHDPQMIRSKKHLLACDPAEWVALCIPCHYVTHWAMRRFHANWEQIRAAFLTDG